jgi:hypothetical protein
LIILLSLVEEAVGVVQHLAVQNLKAAEAELEVTDLQQELRVEVTLLAHQHL